MAILTPLLLKPRFNIPHDVFFLLSVGLVRFVPFVNFRAVRGEKNRVFRG